MPKDLKNIVVADDHALIREGMVSLLKKFETVGIVFDASDGRQALDILLRETIELAILDIRLPGLSGLDVAREIRKRQLPCRIILMTGDVSEEAAANAVSKLSLDAFLFKTADMSQFEQAVCAVLAGSTFFPPNLATIVARSDDKALQLSTRETQVVKLIAEGHTSETAANLLGISPHTVRKHRENIKRKLGLGTVAELSSYALRNQLL